MGVLRRHTTRLVSAGSAVGHEAERRPSRSRSLGRGALAALVVVCCVLPAHAWAQPQVTTTAILFADDGATDDDVARVTRALRRSLSKVRRVRFADLADALEVGEQAPEEVEEAREGRDQVAQLLASGDADAATERIRGIVETFEANLVHVPRSELADAYMLAAVAECVGRRMRPCRDGFRRVITFRESLQYDIDRYPVDYLTEFDNVRERTVGGPRGLLEVATVPTGGEVFVDGRAYGAAPTVVDGLLAGDHYLTVKLPGYSRVVRRVTVEPETQASVEVELTRSDRALLIEQDMPRIRREAGGARTGRYTQRLSSTLFVNQAVLGVVRREGTRLEVRLFLYDLRTRFLLRRLSRTVRAPPGQEPRGIDQLGTELYEGVDLRGHVAAPEDRPPEQTGPTPLYGRWWFWTAIGVVVTAGVVTAVVVGGQEASVPDGYIRLGGSLR